LEDWTESDRVVEWMEVQDGLNCPRLLLVGLWWLTANPDAD